MKEQKAVEQLKFGPKYIYIYAKSTFKTMSSINLLFDSENNVTSDNKCMSDILEGQFQSVFSDPNNLNTEELCFDSPEVVEPM